MDKIHSKYIVNQYRSGIENYSKMTTELGLWESEKYAFNKYLNQSDNILDLGCGTGRTTFPLHQLGFTNIIGVDLTPEMIYRALELNTFFNTGIKFEIGDATNLKFSDHSFDVVIFSFNGLMSIPNSINRSKALGEINRVLKESGTFIFTTHDRDKEEGFFTFWSNEKEKWNLGNQDSSLYEFGDLIATSKNETNEIFIHIPNQTEVRQLLANNGFETVETFYRSDSFHESEIVKSHSGSCRFWITKKV